MNATVSQQQSTQARMGATRAAWEAFRQSPCPLFGQGNGSYSLAIDPVQNQDSTQTYTSIAPNLPILLLGAFRKNLFTMPLPEEPALTDELLLAGVYGTKFTDWYGCRFLLFKKTD